MYPGSALSFPGFNVMSLDDHSSFELASAYAEVVGIDFSHSFIKAANQLKSGQELKYKRYDEGDLFTELTAKAPAVDLARLTFEQGFVLFVDHLAHVGVLLLNPSTTHEHGDIFRIDEGRTTAPQADTQPLFSGTVPLFIPRVRCCTGTPALSDLMSVGVHDTTSFPPTLLALSVCLPSHRDACNLRADLGDFDLVLASNLVCRVPDARAFLKRLPSLVKPGGVLFLTTPFTWMTQVCMPAHAPPARRACMHCCVHARM